MNRRTRSRAGFSLAETLVVMTVLGIAGGIAFLPGVRYVRQMSVKESVAAFTAVQSLTRSAALQFAGGAELHIDASADRYWIIADTSSAAGVDTISTVRSTGEVDLFSTDSILCYDSRSLPATGASFAGSTCGGPAAVVILAGAGMADTIRISAMGRIER